MKYSNNRIKCFHLVPEPYPNKITFYANKRCDIESDLSNLMSLIKFFSLASLIRWLRPSLTKRNKYDESEKPCLFPLLPLKKVVGEPLTKIKKSNKGNAGHYPICDLRRNTNLNENESQTCPINSFISLDEIHFKNKIF